MIRMGRQAVIALIYIYHEIIKLILMLFILLNYSFSNNLNQNIYKNPSTFSSNRFSLQIILKLNKSSPFNNFTTTYWLTFGKNGI